MGDSSLNDSKVPLGEGEMVFLDAKCGDFVVICFDQNIPSDWWIGRILSRLGNSRDPTVNTIFQVVNVDTGDIRTINADCVIRII